MVGCGVSACRVPIPLTCSETLFFEMADRLAEDGWRELGYKYINIDDCWSAKKRDAAGRLVPDPERFPRGIKALADYVSVWWASLHPRAAMAGAGSGWRTLGGTGDPPRALLAALLSPQVHARGLKLGIYGDLGTLTCGGYPGTTLDRVKQDAQTFAEWGVDMLKLDGCYSSGEEQAEGKSSPASWHSSPCCSGQGSWLSAATLEQPVLPSSLLLRLVGKEEGVGVPWSSCEAGGQAGQAGWDTNCCQLSPSPVVTFSP